MLMLDHKRSRLRKPESKSHKSTNDPSQSFLSTKKALQKLSLSFYGEDTMKKTKQIIFDDCELYDALPEVSSIMKQRITQEKKKFKETMRSTTVNKDIHLKIDSLFMDDKVDQFQFVTTNASQLDHPKDKTENKKKVSRSNSVKVKDNDRSKKENLMMDVYSARCKTSKCVSRKGKVPEKKMKKK